MKCKRIRTDHTGAKFGDLTVLRDAPISVTTGHRMVVVRCACGNEKTVDLPMLLQKSPRSCGCKAYDPIRSRYTIETKSTSEYCTEFDSRSIHDLLTYNPETGILTWKTRPEKYSRSKGANDLWNGRFAGQPAGCVDAKGYLILTILKKYLRAHQVIMLMVHGYIPDSVDHINGDKTDNRLSNLRISSRAQNQHNQKRPCTNTSGVKGVWLDPRKNKWVSQIRENNVRHWVGSFDTIEEAERAVKAARENLHGEFANHG